MAEGKIPHWPHKISQSAKKRLLIKQKNLIKKYLQINLVALNKNKKSTNLNNFKIKIGQTICLKMNSVRLIGKVLQEIPKTRINPGRNTHKNTQIKINSEHHKKKSKEKSKQKKYSKGTKIFQKKSILNRLWQNLWESWCLFNPQAILSVSWLIPRLSILSMV